MSLTVSPTPADVQASVAPARPVRTLRSCLLTLYASAAFWLVLSSVFSLIVSIKFHGPGFLADTEWLTYGRVRAASMNLLLYGFCIPAALGIALWILSRSGRAALVFPAGIFLGALLLNIGIALGLGGMLAGDLTGFEVLEMPRYAALFVFLGYALVGASAVLTLHLAPAAPVDPEEVPAGGNAPRIGLSVPEWFVLAAVFWFPWIYSTANLLLQVYPVRGVAQPVIAWWYGANVQLVWLGLTGLAAGFYLLPRIVGRPLDSRYLALFAFWVLVLFGSWSGVPQSAPVPAWMPSLSTVAMVLTSLALLPILLVCWRTSHGSCRASWAGLGRFVSFGISSFLLAGLLAILPIAAGKANWSTFTWIGTSRWLFGIYGFFVVIAIALICYSLAATMESETGPVVAPNPKLPRPFGLIFWLAAIGTLVAALPLLGAGVVQGIKLANPDVAFVDVTRATLHFLRLSTIGEMMILGANSILLMFLLSVIGKSCRERFRRNVALLNGEEVAR